jgi:O-antigen ligase
VNTPYRPREQVAGGFLHWMLPLMLLLVAATVLLSGRDLSPKPGDHGMYLHPAAVWLQRGVSLVLLLISAERLLHLWRSHRGWPAPVLTCAFVAYWAAAVAASALFGAHPQLSHEYLYPLVFGLAALSATATDRDRVLDAVRNALFLFLLAGAVTAAIQPGMVLDMEYRQGLLPGVPRFAGLAPHPVALAIFALSFLLCLWVRPFRSRTLTVLGWLLGAAVLFLSQSKTSWIAFLLCSAAMLAMRRGAAAWRRMGDPREGAFGIVLCIAVIVVVSAVVALLLFADLGGAAADFMRTPEGAQLMTLTGRDRIWAIAMQEWHASPVFGYGPELWDDAFRASIGMPYAMHAHNQFIDTLARSGTFGAVALVLYAAVLVFLSFRTARATGGLSVGLCIALALRSVSEVPLLIFGYGTELFTHLLLLIVLASAIQPRSAAVRLVPPSAPYRTAP